jgi:hypothetical protein
MRRPSRTFDVRGEKFPLALDSKVMYTMAAAKAQTWLIFWQYSMRTAAVRYHHTTRPGEGTTTLYMRDFPREWDKQQQL